MAAPAGGRSALQQQPLLSFLRNENIRKWRGFAFLVFAFLLLIIFHIFGCLTVKEGEICIRISENWPTAAFLMIHRRRSH